MNKLNRNKHIDIKNRTEVAKGWGEEWIGSSELADANYYTMNEQDPPVLHRELYSISCEKP